MAKKSSKHQSKPTNTSLSTAIATNITPLDNTSPTRVAFREFIELADLNSIKNFITTASSSSEGENLKLLWGRAFKEGLIAGHQLYGKAEERLKEVHEEGFQAGYEEGQRDERGDWALEGHGIHCGYQTTIPYDDYGTPLAPTTTMSVSTQTIRKMGISFYILSFLF